ncbi:MAG: alpha/beta hydrolase fold domain-containing protein [Burkholderiaceae bacterium]
MEVIRDLVYGSGLVRCSDPQGAVKRELKLDLYRPRVRDADVRLPALVLAFGGAFHRGSKENDSFEAEGGNTSVADYCRRFARRGYLACAIDYRLVTEDPDPGRTPVVQSPESIPTTRVDVVRRLMQLPPATSHMLWCGIEAASDDMAAATRYLLDRASMWGIDPDRVAVGGFSAGARTALNVALGEKVPVAAVVSLSGYMHHEDLQRHITRQHDGPAVLVVSAQNDLEYIVEATPRLVDHLRTSGLHCEQVVVPDAGHFYGAEAVALHDRDGVTTVEEAMAAFLARALARTGEPC